MGRQVQEFFRWPALRINRRTSLEDSYMIDLKTASTLVGLITSLGAGGWWASENLAQKEEVQIAVFKADVSLDKHIEALTKQAALIEAKGDKATRSELEQLKYIRDEIKRLRETRQGK